MLCCRQIVAIERVVGNQYLAVEPVVVGPPLRHTQWIETRGLSLGQLLAELICLFKFFAFNQRVIEALVITQPALVLVVAGRNHFAVQLHRQLRLTQIEHCAGRPTQRVRR